MKFTWVNINPNKFQRPNITCVFMLLHIKSCLYRLRDIYKYFSPKTKNSFNNSEKELKKVRFQSFILKKVVLSVRIDLNLAKFIHIALGIQIDSDS